MSSTVTKCAPYQSLAEIYDYVMRHVDYDHWAGHIHAILERYDHRVTRLVDLACGTGNATTALHDLGYAVSGVELSQNMVEVAREKAALLGRDIEYFQGDLRRLEGLGPFDTAVCLYDSFNYLLTPRDLARALEEVYAILLPGGIFVFDVCTERNSLLYFQDAKEDESGPGFKYRRHSRYDREQRLQYNEFHIRFGGCDEVLEEIHCQHIYALDDLVAAVGASPFDLLDFFAGFTFEKGSERADRVHFVLRRSRGGAAPQRENPHVE